MNVIIIVLILASSVSCYSEEWLGYSLWNPQEATTEASFAVLYHGDDHATPKLIQENSGEPDRTSPEALLKSLFAAYHKQDVELYKKLYFPGETTREFSPDDNNKVSRLTFKRIMKYSDYVILLINVQVPAGEYPTLFCAKKIDGKWYASADLPAGKGNPPKYDQAFVFLNYYYAYASLIGMPRESEIKSPLFTDSEYLYITNSAYHSQNAKDPLVFRFLGHDYPTNTIISCDITRDAENLNLTTGVLSSALTALSAHNLDWYRDLLSPLEKTNKIQYGMGDQVGKQWSSLLTEQFGTQTNIAWPKSVTVIREIDYGQSAIMLFRDSNSKADGLGVGWLDLRKINNKWYISDQLNASSNPLINYFGLAAQFNTKLFPDFSKE